MACGQSAAPRAPHLRRAAQPIPIGLCGFLPAGGVGTRQGLDNLPPSSPIAALHIHKAAKHTQSGACCMQGTCHSHSSHRSCTRQRALRTSRTAGPLEPSTQVCHLHTAARCRVLHCTARPHCGRVTDLPARAMPQLHNGPGSGVGKAPLLVAHARPCPCVPYRLIPRPPASHCLTCVAARDVRALAYRAQPKVCAHHIAAHRRPGRAAQTSRDGAFVPPTCPACVHACMHAAAARS